MAYKTAIYLEKCKAVIRKNIFLLLLILSCCMLYGCPIERGLNGNIIQVKCISIVNNCNQDVYFSVDEFSNEIYKGDGIFNTAKDVKISTSSVLVYSWYMKVSDMPAPSPGFIVKDDFSLIVSVRGKRDKVYTKENLFGQETFSDGFIHSVVTKSALQDDWKIYFCPRSDTSGAAENKNDRP